MNNFDKFVTEDRRLVVLKLLAASGGYEAGEYLLQTALDQFGHNIGIDRLRQDLAWLQEQSLLTITEVSGVQIAKLNNRGLDVASGRVTVPGVKRPQPE